MTADRLRPAADEIANALTHGAGLIASLIALPLLLAAAVSRGDARLVIGCSVFAGTLIALYTASTIYHLAPPSRTKEILQRVDHAAIYLLIAGTYTPFTIGVLRDAWGWSLFGIVWGLALVGVLYKSLLGIRFPRLSLTMYLTMGWLAIFAARPLANVLPLGGLLWLLAGGLSYTVGTLFYVRERRRFDHMVWHLFVLAGSACHVVAVWLYALPAWG